MWQLPLPTRKRLFNRVISSDCAFILFIVMWFVCYITTIASHNCAVCMKRISWLVICVLDWTRVELFQHAGPGKKSCHPRTRLYILEELRVAVAFVMLVLILMSSWELSLLGKFLHCGLVGNWPCTPATYLAQGYWTRDRARCANLSLGRLPVQFCPISTRPLTDE